MENHVDQFTILVVVSFEKLEVIMSDMVLVDQSCTGNRAPCGGV